MAIRKTVKRKPITINPGLKQADIDALSAVKDEKEVRELIVKLRNDGKIQCKAPSRKTAGNVKKKIIEAFEAALAESEDNQTGDTTPEKEEVVNSDIVITDQLVATMVEHFGADWKKNKNGKEITDVGQLQMRLRKNLRLIGEKVEKVEDPVVESTDKIVEPIEGTDKVLAIEGNTVGTEEVVEVLEIVEETEEAAFDTAAHLKTVMAAYKATILTHEGHYMDEGLHLLVEEINSTINNQRNTPNARALRDDLLENIREKSEEGIKALFELTVADDRDHLDGIFLQLLEEQEKLLKSVAPVEEVQIEFIQTSDNEATPDEVGEEPVEEEVTSALDEMATQEEEPKEDSTDPNSLVGMKGRAMEQMEKWGDELSSSDEKRAERRQNICNFGTKAELQKYMDDIANWMEQNRKAAASPQAMAAVKQVVEVAVEEVRQTVKELTPRQMKALIGGPKKRAIFGMLAQFVREKGTTKSHSALAKKLEDVAKGKKTRVSEGLVRLVAAFFGQETLQKLVAQATGVNVNVSENNQPATAPAQTSVQTDNKEAPVADQQKDEPTEVVNPVTPVVETDDTTVTPEGDATPPDQGDNTEPESSEDKEAPVAKKDEKKDGLMKRWAHIWREKRDGAMAAFREIDARYGVRPLPREEVAGYRDLLQDTIGLLEGGKVGDEGLLPEDCRHKVVKDKKEVSELRPAADILDHIVRITQEPLKGKDGASKRANLKEGGKVRARLRKALKDGGAKTVVGLNTLFGGWLVRNGHGGVVKEEVIGAALVRNEADYYLKAVHTVLGKEETKVSDEDRVKVNDAIKALETADSKDVGAFLYGAKARKAVGAVAEVKEVKAVAATKDTAAVEGVKGVKGVEAVEARDEIKGLIPTLKGAKLLKAVEAIEDVDYLSSREQKLVRKYSKDPIAGIERAERVQRQLDKLEGEEEKALENQHRHLINAFAFIETNDLWRNPLLENQEILVKALLATRIKDSSGNVSRLHGLAKKEYAHDLATMIVEEVTSAGDALEGYHRRIIFTLVGRTKLKGAKVDGGSWVRYYSYKAVRETILFGKNLVSWACLPVKSVWELTGGIVYDLLNKGDRTIGAIVKARASEAWQALKDFGWNRPKAFFVKTWDIVSGWFKKDESKGGKTKDTKGVFGRIGGWATTVADKAKEYRHVTGGVVGAVVGAAVGFFGFAAGGWMLALFGGGGAVVGGAIAHFVGGEDKVKDAKVVTPKEAKTDEDAGESAGDEAVETPDTEAAAS